MNPLTLDWKAIEEKWQKKWSDLKVFETNPQTSGKKLFVTVAYPYPNSPQHVGHGRTFTLTDVYARFKRMQGYNVLFPMAFHYTGTPILAISKRIASEDTELINDFINIYKVPPELLKTFVEPLEIARYFHNEIREGMKEIGYSIDWRREFTTIDPPYSRFIEWQFRKLQDKGLIAKGSHPVGWCQNCENPMGQHDTKGDVEPEIGEFTLLKFKLDEVCLPTGTLRPETIYGVTNLWVRPDIEYVKIKIDKETWIVSEECAEKLALLDHSVSVIGKIKGSELIGKHVQNPVTRRRVLILPASFVDPKNATGIVMSVPAHAPYDYIALEDLKKDKQRLTNLGLNFRAIYKINPISLIYLDGYSEFPASDIVSRLGIKGLTDTRIDDATKEIYRQELHNGKMKENTGRYATLSVFEAREKIKEHLLSIGKADAMYELLNRPVYCRCGGEIIVKIFRDQWFIDYSNPSWKVLAHKCLDAMNIFPEDLRVEFNNVIDWLKEKACARKQGLGTKLPWDSQWIIESLSDSVIYMSYYTISRCINEHKIDAEKLDDQVFDYIFLGKGNPNSISKEKGFNPSLLQEMKREFNYFYPLDSRHSGRDLVQNHLTYFIFNHVAIFPEEFWPKQIVVNGSVLMEGKKMSKSLGNIIPLREALSSYGADPFRLAILATAELLQDADFSSVLAKALEERLERFYFFTLQCIELKKESQEQPLTTIDLWFLTQLQLRIKVVTEAMEKMRFREALHNVIYMLDQDVQWYLKRSTSNEGIKGSASILKQIMETRVLLLAPFAPHLCEELWEKMGKPSLVFTSNWPRYEEAKVDTKIIEVEELIKMLREDVLKIVQATKTSLNHIIFYTAAAWKWRIYIQTLDLMTTGQVQVSDVIKKAKEDPEFKKNAKAVSLFVQKTVGQVSKIPMDLMRKRLDIDILDENKILLEVKDFYEREFNTKITIYAEEDPKCYDPKSRARFAEPYRPAIYIE